MTQTTVTASMLVAAVEWPIVQHHPSCVPIPSYTPWCIFTLDPVNASHEAHPMFIGQPHGQQASLLFAH